MQLSDFLTRCPAAVLADITISRYPVLSCCLIPLLPASPHPRTATSEDISGINGLVEFFKATPPDVTQGPPYPSLEKLELTPCATRQAYKRGAAAPVAAFLSHWATSLSTNWVL